MYKVTKHIKRILDESCNIEFFKELLELRIMQYLMKILLIIILVQPKFLILNTCFHLFLQLFKFLPLIVIFKNVKVNKETRLFIFFLNHEYEFKFSTFSLFSDYFLERT